MTTNHIQLPLTYEQQMTNMLQEETAAFLASYNEPRTFGLRIQPRKWNLHQAARDYTRAAFQLRPVPWCEEGYYYAAESRPGKHPYHAAGLFYIQEPSAMSAVALLDPKPHECVLDLAAAPGGKSTQIAGRLAGTGVLIANEIHRERARILSENVERMGYSNVIVTNSDPDTLAARFPQAFDCIMLDAPCSGEGMFRKDADAIQEWSLDHVRLCADRQWDIIQAAVQMLRPGGRIAYSTCTFNEEENERTIARWLEQYPDFELLKMERIWPHKQEGEGHFVAVLKLKESNQKPSSESHSASVQGRFMNQHKKEKKRAYRRRDEAVQARSLSPKAAYSLFIEWAEQALPNWRPPAGEPILFGDELYWLPYASNDSSFVINPELLHGLKVPRPGLHLAHLRKQRIEPAHALALSLTCGSEAALSLHLRADSDELRAYLSGHTLQLPEPLAGAKGWILVTVDGLPLGWGKASAGILKNHYPKGLRLLHL